MNFQRIIGKVKLGVKRNAPELLLGGALITGTACVALSSKATIKATAQTSNMKFKKELLECDFNNGVFTEDELKTHVKSLYAAYALDLAKTYAVPAALYVATVASIFSSYKIQKNRTKQLSAALTACTAAYTTLLAKLKNGAEHGLTAKEVMDGIEVRDVIDPETGEVTTEKVQGTPVEGMYEFRFDRYTSCWEKSKLQNEATLTMEQNWANDKLRLQGHVFLNDILNRLGIPPTHAGQIVGWTNNGDGDGYIDFGIEDLSLRDDALYDENAFILNFNVDGDILQLFKAEEEYNKNL